MPDDIHSVKLSEMPFSLSGFGKALGEQTGIGELMEDLGAALAEPSADLCMMGGGQPAHIPEMVAVFQRSLLALASEEKRVQAVLGQYDPAEGNKRFRAAMVELFNGCYDWGIGVEHVGLAAGGQSACFHLMNALVGEGEQVLMPLIPDYMGYRDQLVSGAEFLGIAGLVEEREGGFFKYRLDREAVRAAPMTVKMMVVSRPTNPSGNVLSEEEMAFLSEECAERGIPLLVDHAYGEPFPAAQYVEVESVWMPHHIHQYSLSKLGLPGTRTAVVVAPPAVVRLLGNMTAVTSLANANVGQEVVRPLVQSGELLQLARQVVRPFYEAKCAHALGVLREELTGCVEYKVHEPEGAFFLWIWLPTLPISSRELVERLKQRGLLCISGHWFFYGTPADEEQGHSQQCIRLTYAMEPAVVERGVALLREELQELCPTALRV